MGTSCGGVAIKTNTKDLDLGETLSKLFGGKFVKSEDYCEHRQSDCLYVAKNENFLLIYHAELVDEIFTHEKSNYLQQIYDYFDKPSLVFAFEEYDSGGTYSYAIFENGEMVRKYRYYVEEAVIDEGEFLPVELKWKNARSEMEYDEDDDEELGLIYFDPDDEEESYAEEDLPRVILYELMNEKLGFDNDTAYDLRIEDGYFKKVG